MVALRYQRICLTTLQYDVFGECMNWKTLFTAKEMSSLVREKYWRLPTMLFYKVGSSKSRESDFDNLREAAIRDEMGFA